MRERKGNRKGSTEDDVKNGKEQLSTKTSVDSSKPGESKWAKLWKRTYTSLLMAVAFGILLYIGHFAMAALCFVLQILVYSEILKLTYSRIATKIPKLETAFVLFPYLNWWWFFVTCFYLYGKMLIHRFPNFFYSGQAISLLARYHTFIAFSLYTIGFVTFVSTLRKGFYKYQFKQLAYTHMTLFIAIMQSSPFVSNIFDGLIWFLLPAVIIMCNDTWAYIWGFFFGRKVIDAPLTPLSPNKTWEGFIGAFLSTIVFAWYASYFLAQFDWFVCPKKEFYLRVGTCDKSLIFLPTDYELPWILSVITGSTTVQILPIQVHATVFAIFGSIIAPFGGFFASGLKRTLKIKDFGDSIPGHGGVSDRFDCHIVMACFSYIYLNTFVKSLELTANNIIVGFYALSHEDQLLVYNKILKHIQQE